MYLSRAWERFQFSNADVVGLTPERLATAVPPHPRTSEGAAHGAGTASPSTLVRSAGGATGANVRSPRPCIPRPRLRRPSPSQNAPDFHESFPRRAERQGRPCQFIRSLFAARTNASGVFQGVVLVLGPPPTNAITVAG